jgi:hypothetical protein
MTLRASTVSSGRCRYVRRQRTQTRRSRHRQPAAARAHRRVRLRSLAWRPPLVDPPARRDDRHVGSRGDASACLGRLRALRRAIQVPGDRRRSRRPDLGPNQGATAQDEADFAKPRSRRVLQQRFQQNDWRAILAARVAPRARESVDDQQARFTYRNAPTADVKRLLCHDGYPRVDVGPKNSVLRRRVRLALPEHRFDHRRNDAVPRGPMRNSRSPCMWASVRVNSDRATSRRRRRRAACSNPRGVFGLEPASHQRRRSSGSRPTDGGLGTRASSAAVGLRERSLAPRQPRRAIASHR